MSFGLLRSAGRVARARTSYTHVLKLFVYSRSEAEFKTNNLPYAAAAIFWLTSRLRLEKMNEHVAVYGSVSVRLVSSGLYGRNLREVMKTPQHELHFLSKRVMLQHFRAPWFRNRHVSAPDDCES